MLALALATAMSLAGPPPVPVGPCGPIARPYDHVELEVIRLRRLGGTALDRVGVVAYRDGVAQPIPFQIDERIGRRIAMADGPEPSDDDVPGVLDPDDALVFMACDLGARAPANAVLPATHREIVVADAVDGTTGYAYVVVADAPPRTDRRYVTYDAAHDMVIAARYRVGMVGALPEYFAVALDGPLGANLVDGLRLRADAVVRGDIARWSLHERDGRHALVAWHVGPVRVVRRSRHEVEIGLGIHLSAGIAHTYFYAQHVFGPGALKLPISPQTFFKDIRALGGVDMRGLEGWRYVAPNVPAPGFAIDGHMDAAEQAFASTGEWFALTHGKAAIMVVTTMSENLRRAIPLELVYVDDAERTAPPEKSRGSVPLVALRGKDVQKLEAGRYAFQLHVFGLTDYEPGGERRVLRQLETPLTAAVTKPASLEAAPAARP